jgi:acetyltransferase-like isoleucine patch superfamily enzyme
MCARAALVLFGSFDDRHGPAGVWGSWMLFDDDDRANELRTQILTYFISSVMTDDERARLLGLPEGCRIREGAKIISPEKLTCGTYVWIGESAILDASGELTIGDHSTIASHVFVWTHTSYRANLAFDNRIASPLTERRPTRIGRGCYVGGPSVIYPGVTLGDRTVVLPMSVVTNDLPGNCMAAGAPAKIIRDLDEDPPGGAE